MDVGAVNYDVTPSSTTYDSSKSSLGKDAFLKLLVTQMQHQDPLEPASDTEFIAQMAQFSNLEQLQNLNGSMNNLTSYELVGKNVVASVNGSTIEGIIDSVRIESDATYAIIDGSSVNVNNIKKVNDNSNAEEDTQLLTYILSYLDEILAGVKDTNNKIGGSSTEEAPEE